MNIEIKKQLRDQGQDVDDRDIFKHYILPHFEGALEDLQGTCVLGNVRTYLVDLLMRLQNVVKYNV